MPAWPRRSRPRTACAPPAAATRSRGPRVLLRLLEEERAIFSGDNVLGAGSSWFEGLATYMRTLNDMLRLAEGEKLVALYPAGHGLCHGPPSADPAAKIREYVDHRGAREGQVRAALDDAGRTSLEIVLAIYPKLPPYLTFAAQHNVLAHLAKLRADGVAENRRFDLWARVAP
ncbi:hydroxyacylglutathione hydrolase [Aureococcus anophagefferens]|nr:hydroxyacylglutathione hydrolase [Aureococcus anophagefferens]